MSGSLREVDWQIAYGPADDRVNGFYVPALKRAVRYDRSAGFFTSSALVIAAAGLAHLLASGGHMRLLVGAKLDPHDVDAIAAGRRLADVVAERMLGELADVEETLRRERHAAMAWMIAEGRLEIRVVLPRGAGGLPLAADDAVDYYHPKEGIFEDATGDRIAFSGSVNESETAWLHNYEQFSVYRSWDASAPYLAMCVRRFDELWEGREPNWIGLPIPDAVQERLLSYRSPERPVRDPLEAVPGEAGRPQPAHIAAAEAASSRVLVQFVRDGARLPGASRFGAATSAITPWPHQDRVADAIIDRFPERFLIADEVGLGKTIEAGLVVRQLLLSGRVGRALLLAPASVVRQWQEELYEKFNLDVPRYDGTGFVGYFGNEVASTTPNPFDAVPFALVSAQLAKRPGRREQLLSARPFDLVIVDEAHHARRRDFQQLEPARPNRLLALLQDLKHRTRGLLLLTATPMQVHPVEVWDLLRLVGLGGRWGARERTFLRFFEELRHAPDEVDWDFVGTMFRDEEAMGGRLDPASEEAFRASLGLVRWEQVREALAKPHASTAMRHLGPRERAVGAALARQLTPLRRLVYRNTRPLLRRYQAEGILKENVPTRDVRPVWVTMRPDEAALYERIEEYISHFYARYEHQRVGLGFIMTVYRRRLTSSFHAVRRSLERRLAFLTAVPDSMAVPSPSAAAILDQGPDELAPAGLSTDDLEEADLDEDILERIGDEGRERFRDEIRYVEDFLHALDNLGTESKLERLLSDVRAILRDRDSVVIFTQYTDTMDFLREALREVYGRQVACFSGRGGERWRDDAWVSVTKEELKTAFRTGEEVRILLGTEALGEGLNLQTCGALINFDMPWNPMRVEQRIGRIDRIGQRYEEIRVLNYFYEDTVEAIVYQRLSDRIEWFVNVVGELQPILSQVGRSIQRLAVTPREARARELEQELDRIRAEIDEHRFASLDLDAYLDEAPATPRSSPLGLKDLEALLTNEPTLRSRFRPHPQLQDAWLLSWAGSEIGVTFSPSVFDEHPDTVRFLSPGSPLFEALVASVERPALVDRQGIVRASADGVVPRVAYYALGPEGPHRLGSLEGLQRALAAGPTNWSAEQLDGVHDDMRELVRADLDRERRALRQLSESERRALQEQGRDLLLRAAHVELALGRQPGLLPDPMPVIFSEEAVTGLARHRYPWAPLLRLVPLEGAAPSPTDEFYLEIQAEPPERLRRRMTDLAAEAKRLLSQLATSVEDFALAEPDVSVEWLAVPPVAASGSSVR